MTGSKRYCVIHGHFYQPPRENPWLDQIETQSSAAPYHDWNERIYDECYRPNARSRILDEEGRIRAIHNNYARMSFNIGPTLLRWIEEKHPAVARRIYDADAQSVKTFDGHGNALAQVYNHIIMPHASRRDKITQIRWARTFFKSRFNREPEGFWLSETAINMETVVCLIEEGVRFVVLSPNQAEAWRPLHSGEPFQKTETAGIDIRRPYRIYPTAPDGTKLSGYLDVFFFDEPLSRSVSFEGALDSADVLAGRLSRCYSEHQVDDELVTVATDGETFGHHKAFGDMCLAYFFAHGNEHHDIVPVNFGWYLAQHQPRHEVTLKNAHGEGTAWSCAHGTGRWIRDCGCQTGGYAHWNQKWRTPFRDALNELQRHLDIAFEEGIRPFTADPWGLRNAYQELFDAPNDQRDIRAFMQRNGGRSHLSDDDVAKVSALLEAQRYMLYGFTSCAWFFTDIAGIETVQNLMYAGRAAQLGLAPDQRTGVLNQFMQILDMAKSNVDGQTGRTLFEKYVLPNMRHLEILAFTAAVHKIVLHSPLDEFPFFGYRVRIEQTLSHHDGTLCTDGWRADVRHPYTHERSAFSVTVSHENGARIKALVHKLTKENEGGGEPLSLQLSNLYIDSKAVLTEHFMEQIAGETLSNYLSWVENKEDVLNALAEVNGQLPEHLRGPASYILTSLFDAHIQEIASGTLSDDVFAQLLSIHSRTLRFGVKIDYARSIHRLQETLLSELDKWAHDLDEKHGDRIRYILNVVDRFAVPMPKAIVEDRFHEILSTSVAKLHSEYCETPTPSRKLSLLQMVGFARRLNFNTDAFALD